MRLSSTWTSRIFFFLKNCKWICFLQKDDACFDCEVVFLYEWMFQGDMWGLLKECFILFFFSLQSLFKVNVTEMFNHFLQLELHWKSLFPTLLNRPLRRSPKTVKNLRYWTLPCQLSLESVFKNTTPSMSEILMKIHNIVFSVRWKCEIVHL